MTVLVTDTFGGQKRYERSVCAQKDPQCRNQRPSKTQPGSSPRKLGFARDCPRSAGRTSDVSRTAQVKERVRQVHPVTILRTGLHVAVNGDFAHNNLRSGTAFRPDCYLYTIRSASPRRERP